VGKGWRIGTLQAKLGTNSLVRYFVTVSNDR
jgi:hypothetical protein